MKKSKSSFKKDEIKEKLKESRWFVIYCLLIIYDNQTWDEKEERETKHFNNIGFNGADGNILSSFCEQIKRWKNTPELDRKYNFPLSSRQFDIAQKKMYKYSGQLSNFLTDDINLKDYEDDLKDYEEKNNTNHRRREGTLSDEENEELDNLWDNL